MKKTILLLTLFVALWAQLQSQNVPIGGQTMQPRDLEAAWLVIPSGVSDNLYSVHFADNNTGYIGGATARCLKSTNEGKNWSPVSVPSVADFQTVWATSPDDAYLGGWDTVYATHNGGQSWYDGYTNSFLLAVNDLQFLSANDGYAFMQYSTCVETNDAGNTWDFAGGSGIIEDYLAGFMLNENTGFVVGQCGHIAKTEDGGEVWLFYEWNGYLDWSCIDITGVHFTSYNNGYAVADSGVVFRTTDGGNYWSRTEIAGPEDRLTDVFFLNANTGYISGYNGLVFKTTDGGDNWNLEPIITSNNLNGVFFMSEDLGWVVGDNGAILRFGVGGPDGVGEPGVNPVGTILPYPNPAGDFLQIDLNLLKGGDYSLQLIDPFGRVVQEALQADLKPGKFSIEAGLSGLPSGVYVCRLSDETGKGVSKVFIKQ